MKSLPKPALAFYSYAHKDEALRKQLSAHLASLMREGLIREWHDREIKPGAEWAPEISQHLETADVILLLVSSDYTNSDFCWGKEMPRALDRHRKGEALVIPIILRPCRLDAAPFNSLQTLPKDRKPVTEWRNRDKAWANVAEGISNLLKDPETPAPAVVPAPGSLQLTQPSPPAIQLSLRRISQRPGGQPRRTIYDAKNGQELPGEVVRREGDPATNNAAVDEAYDGIGAAFYFFWDIFGRNSIDGNGMPLTGTVHYDEKFDNAFWTGSQLVLGDGGTFNRFTRSVDVIAAELSKGFVEHEAGLIYYGQTASLLCSLADVFGSLVKQYVLEQTADKADWLLGDKLVEGRPKWKALRSLAKPGTAWHDPSGHDEQPAHMKDFVKSSDMNTNSGIPNHAFYLLAKELGGYAWDKAGNIWYQAVCDKRLAPKASFLDFARRTLESAQRLYGVRSPESKVVKSAWEKVGIKLGPK